MKKSFLAILTAIALLGGIDARAGAPRIRYGLEWGVTPTFLQSWHFNYISGEGYRVDDSGRDHPFTFNGFVYAHFGVNVTDALALSLYGGYAGLSKGNRVFPLLFRASMYPKGMATDGLFYFAEAGAGFHAAKQSAPSLPAAALANAGAGYHLALSRSIGLDFQLSLRGAFDHQRIKDADTGNWVPDADIRRNDMRAYALCLSIGLSF